MKKKYILSEEDIQPLVHGYGGCIASDKITVEGYPVGFMYRQEPLNEIDSGWCFLSGFEHEDYMSDSSNHDIYDVNTIANYDPSIIPLLDSDINRAFERTESQEQLLEIADWKPSNANGVNSNN